MVTGGGGGAVAGSGVQGSGAQAWHSVSVLSKELTRMYSFIV